MQKILNNFFDEKQETETKCPKCLSTLLLKNSINNFPNYIVLRIERNNFRKFPRNNKKKKNRKTHLFNVMLEKNVYINDVKYKIVAVISESNVHANAYF